MSQPINIQGLNIKKLDSKLFVSSQISEYMMKEIADLGVKLILSNKLIKIEYLISLNSLIKNEGFLASIAYPTISFLYSQI